MRKHAITEYKSVLEVLGKQPGCPICAFLKNEQAGLLQRGRDSPGHLCNAHAWGFAAVGDADVAARALLGAFAQVEIPAEKTAEDCWLCSRLRQVEDGAVSDLWSQSGRPALITWLKAGGACCAPHSAKLRRSSDPDTTSLIVESDSRKRSEILTTLKALISPEGRGTTEQAGALGRASEYLVSQRSLPGWQDSDRPSSRVRRKQVRKGE